MTSFSSTAKLAGELAHEFKNASHSPIARIIRVSCWPLWSVIRSCKIDLNNLAWCPTELRGWPILAGSKKLHTTVAENKHASGAGQQSEAVEGAKK